MDELWTKSIVKHQEIHSLGRLEAGEMISECEQKMVWYTKHQISFFSAISCMTYHTKLPIAHM